MTYEFSIGWFFGGLLILAAGVAFVKWYRVVADNFGGGVGSYERYKLWALITCGVGLIVMVNFHTFLLTWFFGLIFGR